MNEYIKIAEYNDDQYGLITQFISNEDEIIFAYTKFYNKKYTYEFVSKEINDKLIGKYLKNVERN